jgi:hypothetical protein
MRGEAIAEARRLVRRWYLWVLVPVVAVLAWRLLPVNAQFAEKFVNGGDPRSANDWRANYRMDLAAVCTSGLGAGQWLSLLAGALVTVLDRPPATEADLRRRLVAKASVLASYGLLLALVGLAVALPGARSALRSQWGPGELGRAGVSADRLGWPVDAIAVGALTLPLWAVAGVGLGMVLGTWRRLVVVAVGYPLVGVLVYEVLLRGDLHELAQLLVYVPLAPVVGWALLVWFLLLPGLAPIVALLTVCAAGMVLLIGYNVASRRVRLARRAQYLDALMTD